MKTRWKIVETDKDSDWVEGVMFVKPTVRGKIRRKPDLTIVTRSYNKEAKHERNVHYIFFKEQISYNIYAVNEPEIVDWANFSTTDFNSNTITPITKCSQTGYLMQFEAENAAWSYYILDFQKKYFEYEAEKALLET